MDAFDEGIVTTNNFAQARKIVTARDRENRQQEEPQTCTVGQLKQDIADVTKTKTSYVREAKSKENRFMTLLNEINVLWKDADFVPIVQDEGLYDRPDLSGEFHYEP